MYWIWFWKTFFYMLAYHCKRLKSKIHFEKKIHFDALYWDTYCAREWALFGINKERSLKISSMTRKKAKETSMLRCHFSTAHLLSMDFEKREALLGGLFYQVGSWWTVSIWHSVSFSNDQGFEVTCQIVWHGKKE